MSGYATPWSPAEDETIRRYAGYLTTIEIAAKMPGRTASGVMQHAVNVLRLSLRLGIRRPGEPPIMLPDSPVARRPRVGGISKEGQPPDELLSEDGARLLIAHAKARGVSPRMLVKTVMEALVREPTLLNNILDEQD